MTYHEKILLGIGLRGPDAALDEVRQILPSSEVFSSPDGVAIYDTALSLYDAVREVNILTVAAELRGKVEASTIADLTTKAETLGDGAYWARKVLDDTMARRFKAGLVDAGNAIRNARDPRVVVEEHYRNTEKLLNSSSGAERTFADICDEAEKQAEENFRNPDSNRGLPMGLPTDGIVRVKPGHVVVIIGPSSYGKSLCLQHAAGDMALSGNQVLYLTLEMTERETLFRIAAQQSRVSIMQLEYPSGPGQLETTKRVIGEMRELPLDIVYRPGLRITELVPLIRRWVRRKQVKHLACIMVDYLNLIRVPQISESMYRDVGEITSSLKMLAGQLDIAVIAGAQANRQAYGGAVKAEHVGESLKIIQDADVVITIERDKGEDGDLLPTGYLRVRKHRNGPQGKARYKFHPGYLRFESVS